MHEKSLGFKEINSFSSWWPYSNFSLCVYQTHIPTFPKIYQVHQFHICGSQTNRDWHPNQYTSFITSICPFYFLIIINGIRFFPRGNCENYIVNRTPTKVLQGITPKEAWSKIKPYVSHFRVFGCETWAHISNEKWEAL